MLRYDSFKKALKTIQASPLYPFFARNYGIFLGLLVILFFSFLYGRVLSFPECVFGDFTFLTSGKSGSEIAPLFQFLASKGWWFGETHLKLARGFLLGVHFFNGVLVFSLAALLSQIFYKSKASWFSLPAFFSALFFLFSPLAVESLTWVSTSKETLVTTFFLASLVSFLLSLKKQEPFSLWAYAFALLFSFLGLLISPVSFSSFVVLCSVAFLLKEKKQRCMDFFLPLMPFFLLPLAFYNLSAFFVSGFMGLEKFSRDYWDVLVHFFLSPGFYLKNILAPSTRLLNYLPQFSPLEGQWDLSVLLLSTFLFSSFLLFCVFKKWRLTLLPFFFFLLALCSDLRFLSLHYETYLLRDSSFYISSFVGDRYLYLSLAIFLAAFFPMIFSFSEKMKKPLVVMALLLAAGLLSLIPQTLETWSKNTSLIAKAYDLKNTSYPMISSMVRDPFFEGVSLEEMKLFWEEVLKQFPQEKEVLLRYGETLLNLGETEKVKELFLANANVASLFPPSFFIAIGDDYLRKGDSLIASKFYQMGLLYYPQNDTVKEKMKEVLKVIRESEIKSLEAIVYHEVFKGELDKAQRHLSLRLLLDPNNERNPELQRFFSEAQKTKINGPLWEKLRKKMSRFP